MMRPRVSDANAERLRHSLTENERSGCPPKVASASKSGVCVAGFQLSLHGRRRQRPKQQGEASHQAREPQDYSHADLLLEIDLSTERLDPRLSPAEDQRMDIMRTFIGVDDFEVNEMANHPVFVADAVAAEHIARQPGDVQRLAA